MGRNFYLTKYFGMSDSISKQFGLELSPRIHIGKRSAGWQFIFNGIVIKSRDEWEHIISEATVLGWEIRDQYGIIFHRDKFWVEIVDVTKGKQTCMPEGFSGSEPNYIIDKKGWELNRREFS